MSLIFSCPCVVGASVPHVPPPTELRPPGTVRLAPRLAMRSDLRLQILKKQSQKKKVKKRPWLALRLAHTNAQKPLCKFSFFILFFWKRTCKTDLRIQMLKSHYVNSHFSPQKKKSKNAVSVYSKCTRALTFENFCIFFDLLSLYTHNGFFSKFIK